MGFTRFVLRGAGLSGCGFRRLQRVPGCLRLIAGVLGGFAGFFKRAVVVGCAGGFLLLGFDIRAPLVEAFTAHFELGELAGQGCFAGLVGDDRAAEFGDRLFTCADIRLRFGKSCLRGFEVV